MFCENCGQQNNDGSLFCEYCGARMMEPVVSVNPSINNAPIRNKKQKGEKSFAIPIIISLVIMAVAGGLLAFFLLRGKESGTDNNSISYYKSFKEDDVVFPDDGEAYVANQLLVKVSKDMSKDEVEKLIDSYDGEIVGINNVTGIYQVEFSDKSEDELIKIKEDLAGETIVESASLHYVYYNECLIGSDGSLDNTIMGLSDADYDRALVGDLGIVLVGSSAEKTEVDSILTDSDLKDISRDDNSLVSLYEIESEMTQKADDGCEIFEMASNLKPTCDDKQSAYEALNLETANFINSLSENDYDILMIGLKQSEEESFLVGIDDSKAMRRILTVGGMADQASGIDIVAEGSGAQPMEYATSIAAITWISNRDLNAGNIKDILSNSFVINEDGISVLDASVSVEVAKRLRDYKASASDGNKELSLEDIMVVINEVKTERGLISTVESEDYSDDYSEEAEQEESQEWRQLYLEYAKNNDIFNITNLPAEPMSPWGKTNKDNPSVIKYFGSTLFYYDYDNDGYPELYYSWIETADGKAFHVTKYYIKDKNIVSEDYGYTLDSTGYSRNDSDDILNLMDIIPVHEYGDETEYAYREGDYIVYMRYSNNPGNFEAELLDGGEPYNLEDIYRYIESGAVYGEESFNTEDGDDLSKNDDKTSNSESGITSANWKDEYISYINDCYFEVAYYALYDNFDDGIPELYIVGATQRQWWYVYIEDGEVKKSDDLLVYSKDHKHVKKYEFSAYGENAYYDVDNMDVKLEHGSAFMGYRWSNIGDDDGLGISMNEVSKEEWYENQSNCDEKYEIHHFSEEEKLTKDEIIDAINNL